MKLLKNSYYAFRHGQSRANVEGVIISSPLVGTVDYGLTDEGRRQVESSIQSIGDLDEKTRIISSDFTRARETADIIQRALSVQEITVDVRLRERFFGEWDGGPYENYAKAWKHDVEMDADTQNGVESPFDVSVRMWALIESLEGQYHDQRIILVSHGDPLMILMTVFHGLPAGNHQSLAYIETAECRLLNP